MYTITFIDSGKLISVTTLTATVACTLLGYVPQGRVWQGSKLVHHGEIMARARAEEMARRIKQLQSVAAA